ncbi:hypothetical protein ACFDTO_07405 [Microbacteriaceae bacterium 4G12]
MDISNLLVIAAIFILPVALIAALLYFVIRSAVLSALRRYAAEQASGVPRTVGE